MKKDIFVFQNGHMARKDNTLMLQIDDSKHYIPVTDVASIHYFGEVDINKKFVEFASENHILLHYYNYYGYYTGSFYPREYLNSGLVLLKQCEAYMDYEKRVFLAKSFIQGSYKNILQILKYYNRRGKELEEYILKIEILGAQLSDQDTIEKIMAIEGNIRQIYYSCFNVIIAKEAFKFNSRSKRPPKDKINALISFGNTIMYNTVLSQIYETEMDPRIAYLHSTNNRRFSLNLDIAELFKPVIVDRSIFSLLNRRVITEKDFSNELGGIMLKEKARKLFIADITERLNTTISLPDIGHRISYRGLIKMEVYKIQKYVVENQTYKPFLMRW